MKELAFVVAGALAFAPLANAAGATSYISVANPGSQTFYKTDPNGNHIATDMNAGFPPASAVTVYNGGNVQTLTINPPGTHLNCINC